MEPWLVGGGDRLRPGGGIEVHDGRHGLGGVGREPRGEGHVRRACGLAGPVAAEHAVGLFCCCCFNNFRVDSAIDGQTS